MLDGGSPFYDVYGTADGRHVAIGALEPPFFAELCRVLGVAGEPAFSDQYARATWPAMRARIAEVVGRKPLDEWIAAFDGVDACVAPVLRIDEVHDHPHQLARNGHVSGPGGAVSPPSRRFVAYARRGSTGTAAADADFLTRFTGRR